ncbi:hypothetical protein O185_03435 [Photorhabdus temperata J3]|uniref:Uncharacterized protein n=1 Tax=Photorhabdus temperata J3 TaxID=1389415 RepID=U7R2R6_PHOTE|nr:hypothetical protein O185_03435 [Photorhabdus temperata J3]
MMTMIQKLINQRRITPEKFCNHIHNVKKDLGLNPLFSRKISPLFIKKPADKSAGSVSQR